MNELTYNLFDEIPANIDVRDYKGFRQYREEYGVRFTRNGKFFFKLKTRWMFYVAAFRCTPSGQDDFALVQMTDGSIMELPIDIKGRITIHGKKYSRKYWNH